MYQIDFHKPLHIHFIGIGGISMSGLAEILLGEDFKVSGSDFQRKPAYGFPYQERCTHLLRTARFQYYRRCRTCSLHCSHSSG